MRLLTRIRMEAALGGLALRCGRSRITDNTVDQPKMQTTQSLSRGKKDMRSKLPAPPLPPTGQPLS